MRVEPELPELIHSSAGVNAAQGEDVLRAGLGPEHAGLFAPCADEGFAAGLDHTGANEVTRLTERAVLHSGDVADKVAQGFFDRLFLRLACAFLTRFFH